MSECIKLLAIAWPIYIVIDSITQNLALKKVHVLVLMIIVHVQILVGGRAADSPAGESGIEYNDEICMYAEASMDAIGEVKEVTISDCNSGVLSKKFDEAERAKKNIILMIWRL